MYLQRTNAILLPPILTINCVYKSYIIFIEMLILYWTTHKQNAANAGGKYLGNMFHGLSVFCTNATQVTIKLVQKLLRNIRANDAEQGWRTHGTRRSLLSQFILRTNLALLWSKYVYTGAFFWRNTPERRLGSAKKDVNQNGVPESFLPGIDMSNITPYYRLLCHYAFRNIFL
jgi:hypothetical protein